MTRLSPNQKAQLLWSTQGKRVQVVKAYMYMANFCVFCFNKYIAASWNHDVDPVELLKIDAQMTRFRQCIKENPAFLQEKVKQYFQVIYM